MRTAAVIGAGRLGTSLARALAASGVRIMGLACLTRGEAEESRLLIGEGTLFEDNAAAAAGADFVLITVPDQAIAGTAAEMAEGGGDWNDRLVWHCSGLLPAAALDPLRELGADTAASHPVQTFPSRSGGAESFRGIYFGIEAEDEAWERSCGVVEILGGRPIRLRPEEKPLYHAACSTASNLLTALLDTAAAMLRRSGRPAAEARDILMPLAQGTLQNVKELNTERALSGPVARGDADTVAAHLKALSGMREEREIYSALARRSLELAAARGDLPAEVIRAVADRLEGK